MLTSPELLDAVVRVLDSVKVLAESSRGDEVVNLSVILDDLFDDGVDRVGIAHWLLLVGHLRRIIMDLSSPSQ